MTREEPDGMRCVIETGEQMPYFSGEEPPDFADCTTHGILWDVPSGTKPAACAVGHARRWKALARRLRERAQERWETLERQYQTWRYLRDERDALRSALELAERGLIVTSHWSNAKNDDTSHSAKAFSTERIAEMTRPKGKK